MARPIDGAVESICSVHQSRSKKTSSEQHKRHVPLALALLKEACPQLHAPLHPKVNVGAACALRRARAGRPHTAGSRAWMQRVRNGATLTSIDYA